MTACAALRIDAIHYLQQDGPAGRNCSTGHWSHHRLAAGSGSLPVHARVPGSGSTAWPPWYGAGGNRWIHVQAACLHCTQDHVSKRRLTQSDATRRMSHTRVGAFASPTIVAETLCRRADLGVMADVTALVAGTTRKRRHCGDSGGLCSGTWSALLSTLRITVATIASDKVSFSSQPRSISTVGEAREHNRAVQLQPFFNRRSWHGE